MNLRKSKPILAVMLTLTIAFMLVPGSAITGEINDPKEENTVSRYSVVGVQTANPNATDRAQLKENLERNLELIEIVMGGYGEFGFPIKLIVFPEFTIHGLPYLETHEYIERDLAVTIPGRETARYKELAKKYDLYICPGSMLEYDPEYPGHIFNTACIVGPEGVILKYRKINTWEAAEFLFSSPHNIKDYDFEKNPAFPVAKTPIGTLAVGICYDFIFPEVCREFTMQGAEVLIRVSAYMHPFATEFPMNWWTTISQVRSLENVVYGVHVNQGGSLKDFPPYSWPGGTCVVDYEGRILSQVKEGGEQIVFGHIDLGALREWRANTYQHLMPAQIRSEVYTYLDKPWRPQGILKKDEEPTLEKIKRAIDEGRIRVWEEAVEKWRRKPEP